MLTPFQWTLVLFGLVIFGLLLFAVVQIIRSPFSPVQTILFWIAQCLTRFLWRTTNPTKLPLAPGQGAVLVCNHRSSVDPFFIQVVSDRKVHWMVAREYCKKGFVGWFLRMCEVIPVRRGGVDTGAAKAAMRYALAGDLVGMFPEGRINRTDQFMLPVRPGAVWVALKAGVPLLPCYIEGSPYGDNVWSPMFMRARVQVKFGALIDISEYNEREKEADVVEEIMRRCLQDIAALANQTDFTPIFAGRKWMSEEGSLHEA